MYIILHMFEEPRGGVHAADAAAGVDERVEDHEAEQGAVLLRGQDRILV